MISINYLFPPDQIANLPTWRFVFHFKAPLWFRNRKIKEALGLLKAAEWKIIEFLFGLDELPYDSKSGTVAVRIQVPEQKRRTPGALADYESDVWKVYGNMLPSGFGDMFYEAVGWKQ